MKYFFETITSRAYWQYVLFTIAGIESILAIFGSFYLLAESLDFFNIYTKDKYSSSAFFIIFAISCLISILIRRPIKSFLIKFPNQDTSIEVRIADLFEVSGAVMISTNTNFESDVAGGKIAVDSLQGQLTSRYFTGNQNELIEKMQVELKKISGSLPYQIGTTISVNTHGKTFYLTAMSELNTKGNAHTTLGKVELALNGLWKHVREEGELQELVVPAVGTGRGRLKDSRKKMIAVIAESFMEASEQDKFTDKLVIVIRPEDAKKFAVNLYDIKDHLNQVLHA